MSDDNRSKGADHADGTLPEQTEERRRKLLKTATAGGAAIAAGVWAKPSVQTVIVPAHAQATALARAAAGSGSVTFD